MADILQILSQIQIEIEMLMVDGLDSDPDRDTLMESFNCKLPGRSSTHIIAWASTSYINYLLPRLTLTMASHLVFDGYFCAN